MMSEIRRITMHSSEIGSTRYCQEKIQPALAMQVIIKRMPISSTKPLLGADFLMEQTSPYTT
jgi:hypothetical protein